MGRNKYYLIKENEHHINSCFCIYFGGINKSHDNKFESDIIYPNPWQHDPEVIIGSGAEQHLAPLINSVPDFP